MVSVRRVLLQVKEWATIFSGETHGELVWNFYMDAQNGVYGPFIYW